MNKKHVETLRHAGLNTDSYLSLRINRSEIPEGAEVVFQIRDRNGNIVTKPIREAEERYFASNSQFYQQVMADGHIFNPYLHRRFLPSQFRRNIRDAGYNGIHAYVKNNYGWDYVTHFLSGECWKLAMLQRRDPEAYKERSRFFPLMDMKIIFREYAQAVLTELNEAEKTPRACGYGKNKEVYYFIKKQGMIRKDHLRPMRYRFNQFICSVMACDSYRQLSELLERFDFCKLDTAIPVCDTFVKRFLESGAFYTLKQMIMFEGLSIGGNNVTENLLLLNKHPQYNLLWLFRHYDK